jgi:dTDP-4-amino-4,6-dideoxygalactose transaminase
MLNTPFPPWPCFTDEEVEVVARVLRSNQVNYWTGSEGRAFEEEFALWCGTKYAIAVANGTVALELALRGLGIGLGDEVIVTPRSFMASASSVVTVGAKPVFADVDRATGNLSASTIEPVLSSRTRAVIVVHLAGWPCDMDPILELARKNRLEVIEDCAQAHGARYKERAVGSMGDLGAWSFCQDKILTTGGEGGMITTNRDDLWPKLWALRDHGKSWAAVQRAPLGSGFRWLHEGFGTNARMTEMQAAIGRVQLRRVDAWIQARTNHAEALTRSLIRFSGPDGPIRLPTYSCSGCACRTLSEGAAMPTGAPCAHAWYKYYMYVRPENLAPGWDRDRILQEIGARGVPCYHGSCPEIYREKAWTGTGMAPTDRLPIAQELGETSMMFLVHPTLRPQDLDLSCRSLSEVLSAASLKQNGLDGADD